MDVSTFLKSGWRSWLGIVIVTVLAVHNLLGIFSWNDLRYPRILDSDEVSTYTRRFDELRDTLQYYRVAGYRDDGQYAAGWFLAQYSLAPTVLVQGADQAVVVANFHSDESPQRRWVEDSLELIRDYDHGVALYRGNGR